MKEVKIINPFTNEVTTEIINNEELIHGVDSEGRYLGLVPESQAYLHVPYAPADPKFKWDFANANWMYVMTLDEVKTQALSDIDGLAGGARLRFITDVPGQQAVYLTKLQEAEAYIADNANAGPYITAEAEVLNIPLLEAAQRIVNTANSWNNVIGPSIEAIRRKSKIAVTAATTEEEVHAIKLAAILELNSI